MALVLKEGALGATVVCDGTNTITFVPQPPMFTIQKASKQIGGVDLAAQTADMGSMAFITAMFSEKPRAALLAGVLESKYAGREKIDGVECDRVNMKQEGLDWRLFTTTGEKPLARRIEVTIPQQLDMSMDFTGWKLNAPIPNERFKFVPPADAKKVDKLLDDEEKEGEDSDLVDGPMPKLKLKTLEGDVFDTAALKGHPTLVVVWSGEAEHCLNAIKAAMELASAKKLAIYSINIDEKPDKLRIKNFLKTNKLNVKTATDDNHEAIEKLEMEGVPTTFLIDKAGVIRKAYLGYHKDFKSLLEKEIETLQTEKK
jgi:peroxiredoxin